MTYMTNNNNTTTSCPATVADTTDALTSNIPYSFPSSNNCVGTIPPPLKCATYIPASLFTLRMPSSSSSSLSSSMITSSSSSILDELDDVFNNMLDDDNHQEGDSRYSNDQEQEQPKQQLVGLPLHGSPDNAISNTNSTVLLLSRALNVLGTDPLLDDDMMSAIEQEEDSYAISTSLYHHHCPHSQFPSR